MLCLAIVGAEAKVVQVQEVATSSTVCAMAVYSTKILDMARPGQEINQRSQLAALDQVVSYMTFSVRNT